MKTCTKCGETKPLDKFAIRYGRPSKRCLECNRTYHAAYRAAHREHLTAYWREYQRSNPITAARNAQWASSNPDKVRAKTRRHQAKRRTPKWVDWEWQRFALGQAYEIAMVRSQLTGIKWEVDHVIPLHGKTVSGLHVIQNVQVIPQLINRRKSNEFTDRHTG